MKKIWLLLIVATILIGGLILVIGLGWFVWKTTAGNTNTNDNTNTSVLDELVTYNSSYGAICPVGLQFIEAKGDPTVDCECPAGYTMERTIIGGSTGDNCYGPGTECPIFGVECI